MTTDTEWFGAKITDDATYDSLDRSELGFYAVDSNLLTLGARAEISGWGSGESWIGTNRPAGAFNPEQEVFLKALADADEDRMKVATELVHWWGQFPGGCKAKKVVSPYINYEYANRLRDVIDHPELHQYFSVGVWKLHVALRAFKDDIDPSLVLAAMNNE